MNAESKPDFTTKAPSFEDVVAYAVDENIYGKVSLTRFYDYYAKSKFQYHGYLMDWKKKLHEWAERQKGSVYLTAQEQSAYNKLKKATKPDVIMVAGIKEVSVNDYFDYLNDLIARDAI